MAIRTILPFGEAVLRKKAKPVTEFSPKLFKLLDDMKDTLYEADGRAGLAAPQIGILRRVVVMDCGEGLIELINPEIIAMEGEQTGPEACLSYPGYTGIVKRAYYVKVQSMNRQGERFTLEGEGYLARCIQHETDHLNGVLFIDHIEGNSLFDDHSGQSVNVLDALRLSNRDL
ncbi:peptide deformylase [Paenibacillus sp. J2TS4]|uniref:peptide deformylase n=1 Tax=Paenibacillus sp. J2TS4 TaxID=2807194 RepID=UPI001B221B76|nr:peptide deformylase [Paenibacillus sp. J2TS4]GIP32201.1 peptide deformylase [Paenibacillus sp. J2TS4]